ncbi:MAG: AAA family ATPase [Patescibacteria group bacterium]
MDVIKKEKIYNYLQEQIAQADFRARAYVFDEKNSKNPRRNCYIKLKMYLDDFLRGNVAIRWITMPGFRGVGKTTLLSQLYFELNNIDCYKLYLTVDQVTQILGVSLQEVLEVYEEIVGMALERLDKPIILFLDEIQYDKKWGITLKGIFDRSNKVFIFATGSSALSIQNNPDVARRAITEKLYPMNFTEYLKINMGKFEIKGLASRLRKILYESNNATEVFDGLKILEPEVRKYWMGVERLEIDRFVKYGTLPFAVKLKNEGLVYDQIKKILDRVVSTDMIEISQFTNEIISRIPEVLYSISSYEVVSVTNLATDLGISKITLTDILASLEKTETITRVYPYGAHTSQIRKPSKYLFSSPAFRAMYHNFIGNIIDKSSYMGKLLEDTVGMYLVRYLSNRNYSLTYDSSMGGADFIAKVGSKNIIIEVGYGEKGFTQIMETFKRVKAKYGMSVSMSPLILNEEKTAVAVPLSYFLIT